MRVTQQPLPEYRRRGNDPSARRPNLIRTEERVIACGDYSPPLEKIVDCLESGPGFMGRIGSEVRVSAVFFLILKGLSRRKFPESLHEPSSPTFYSL